MGNKKYFQYDGKTFGIDESEVNQFKSDMPAAVEVFPTQDENGQTKYLQQHELPEQPQAEKKKASSNGGTYSTIPGMEKLLSESQSEEQGNKQTATPNTAPQSLKYYAFGSSNVDFSKPTANVRIPESSIPNTVGEKIDRKAALHKAQSLSEFEIIDDEQRQLLQGSDYLQSRTGKVAEYISKIKKGKPIDQKDWQYLKESAPGIVADMVNQVKQGDGSGVLQAVNDENPLPDVISFYKQKYSTNKSYAAAENSKSAILTAQQLGFDINRYDDNKYLSEFMSKINADKQSEIEQAKLKYKPEDAEQFIGGAFVGPKDAMLRSVEFANKTTEIGRKYADLSHTYATASTQLLALKNNSLTPEKLGEHYLSIADPDRYALYKIAGSSDKKVKGELNKIGYNFVRGTLDQSKIASIEKLEDNYNDNFPEHKKEEIYHRLGAEMYKMRESGNGIRPGDIKGYDNIADTQFSKEDREFYYKHVRPEEAAKFIGTNVPLTGFANKLAHGIMTTGIETGKTVLDYLKLRNTQDQAADALKGQEVKYQDVGEYQQGKDRINELKHKPKLSFDEINELKDLERFVGVRSGLSENMDNIGNVTGQVITMALGTKGIGAAGKLAIGGEGLLASASKLEMLEKGGAALLGYAQSYDAARRDYLQLKPTASEDELALYGNWIGFLNAASENIFQDKKVFEAFNKEAGQLASRVFESISDKNISQLTRKELGDVYTALLKDASKFAANYGKNNLQEVAEEEIVQLGTSIADGIAAPDKFNLNNEWEKVKATAVDMAIGGSLVAVPGAIHSSRSSRLTTPLLNQLGFDTKLRTEVTNVINEQVRQNKISQEEANKKLAVVNTVANIHGTTIQQAQEIRPLRKEEIEKITALTLQERINNEKIKAGSEFADELKNQNKEISDMRNKIMRKEVVVNDDYSLTDVDEWNKQNKPKPEPTEAEKLAKANQAQLDADNELVNNINDRNAIPNNANQGNSGSSTTDNINPDNPNTSTENGQNGEGNQGESSQGEPAPTGEKPTTDNGQSDNEQSNVPTDNQGDNGSEINAIESKRDAEIQKINDSNMGAAAKKAAIKRIQDKYQKQIDSVQPSTIKPETNPALRDVDSTAKALNELRSDVFTNAIPISLDYEATDPKSVAEAYHKAKEDGSYPELVKSVESVLNTKQESTDNPTKENKYNIDELSAEQANNLIGEKKPELKDLSERAKVVYDKIKQIKNKAGGLLNDSPEHPFPYRLLSIIDPKRRVGDMNEKEKVATENYEKEISAWENYISNFTLSDEQLQEIKTKREKEDAAKNEERSIRIKEGQDYYLGIDKIEKEKSDFIKSIDPEYSRLIAKKIKDGVTEEQIQDANWLANQKEMYGKNGKDLGAIFKALEKTDYNIPLFLNQLKYNTNKNLFQSNDLETVIDNYKKYKNLKSENSSQNNNTNAKSEQQAESDTKNAKTNEEQKGQAKNSAGNEGKTFADKREKVNNRSNVIKAAKGLDFTGDLQNYTLQQMIFKRFDPAVLHETLGRTAKSNWQKNKNIKSEISARLTWTRKDGNGNRAKSVGELAHIIWEQAQDEWKRDIDDSPIESYVIDAIIQFTSPGDIAQYLVDKQLGGNVNNKQNEVDNKELPEGIEEFWNFETNDWISPLHEKAWNDVLDAIDLMSDDEINSYFTDLELADYEEQNPSPTISNNGESKEAQKPGRDEKTKELLSTNVEDTASKTGAGTSTKSNYDKFIEIKNNLDTTKQYPKSDLSKLKEGDYVLVTNQDSPNGFREGVVSKTDLSKITFTAYELKDGDSDLTPTEFTTGKENVHLFYKPKGAVQAEQKQAKKEQSKQDKILNDIDDIMGELWGKSGLITSGGLDPRKIELGTKLIGKFIELGVYKFQDIASHVYGKFGDAMADFIHELKAVYSSYYNTTTDDIADKMDANVRSVSFDDIKNNSKPIKLNNDEPKSSESNTGSVLPTTDNGPDAINQPENVQSTSEGRGVGKSNQGESRKLSSKNRQKQKPGTGERDLFSGNDAVLDQINQKQEHKPAISFTPEDTSNENFNVARKFNDNLKALNILLDLLSSKRKATNAEKTVLSIYVGYGGLKEIGFDPEVEAQWEGSRSQYRDIVRETIDVVNKIDAITGDKNSVEGIRKSILNAHYTSKVVIDSMYEGLRHLGFDGGVILEPSAGIGNFISFMPNGMKFNSRINAIELEGITGNILKHIHDDVNVKITGFEKSGINNNSHDLVISNIPFGNYSVYDKSFDGKKSSLTKAIHKYFFAKAIDSTREGGLIALVTSTGVLDSKSNQDVRDYINQNTVFLGALRMPNITFKNNAGTQVVTDMVFLQKNTNNNKNQKHNFLQVNDSIAFPDKEGVFMPVTMNQYFIDNPSHVLGSIISGEGLYAKKGYTVIDNGSFSNIKNIVTDILPIGIYSKEGQVGLNEINVINHQIKDGNIGIVNNQIVLSRAGEIEPVKVPSYIKNIDVERYSKLRDALMDLIESEYSGDSDKELDIKRAYLNSVYDSYQQHYSTKEGVKISTKLMSIDGDGYNVLSLTKKDGSKADIFNKRTVRPIEIKQYTDNVDDAIIISLNEKAKIDIDRIAQLMQKPVSSVLQEAKGKIFELPTGGFVTREEYLSGNVKAKLAEAINAVEQGYNEFQYNVEQLNEVQPKDIPYIDIETRLGSRWVPTEYFEQFARELFKDPSIDIEYSKTLDTYDVSNSNSVESVEKYGVPRRSGTEILNNALHQTTPSIIIRDREGKMLKEASENATRDAMVKYEMIRDEYSNWIYRDEERRQHLEKIYNERFNTTVLRTYDGSNLTFPGLISSITFKEHQKSGIARLLYNNGGIIDHIVGAGKTFVIVGTCMELKRTGVAKKPMVIALKSTIKQIEEAFRVFPMAKVLVPGEKDYTKENRKKLLSQIANNEWDAVVITHENYGKIPQSAEFQKELIEEELQELRSERGNITSKRALNGLQIRIENLEKKLDKLSSSMDKDNVLTFQQMGIDHIMVDESQQFKNLSYVTKINNVAGLSKPEGSLRSFNLLIGIRSLQKMLNGDKGVTFLSGTPISNSMVEMYLLFKYIRPNKMLELGLNTFDSWANTFASASSEIEFTVTGQFKTKTRFREFINVPELSKLYTEVADVRTDDNLILPKPKMKTGKYIPVICTMNDEQKEYAKAIIEFAKTKDGSHIGVALSEGQKQAVMLLATNLSAKMAIDMRLIDKSYAPNPEGKISKVTDNVSKIWNETKEYKGVQLIFSDLGTPKDKNDKVSYLRDYMEDELSMPIDTLNEIFGNPNEEGYKKPNIKKVADKIVEILEMTPTEIDDMLVEAGKSAEQFNVYAEIKKQLIEKGVPENEIVFIHDYKTNTQRLKLFINAQNGDVRVILGSTQKLGTGVNVQDRIVALHHVDVPWRPSDMEQRNGRGLRQGNWVAKEYLNNELPVYAYATELTLDAMKYQILSVKQKFLTQVKSGSITDRVVKEDSGDDIGMAEMVAALSGNPDVLNKIKLEGERDKLLRQKKSFDSNFYEAQSKIRNANAIIENRNDIISNTKKDIEDLTNKVKLDEDGKMIIDDVNGEKIEFNEEGKPATRIDYAKKAVSIILSKIGSLPYNKIVPLVNINGIQIAGELTIKMASKDDKVYSENAYLITPNGNSYIIPGFKTPGVLLNKIQNILLDIIPSQIKTSEQVISDNKEKIKYYEEVLTRPEFPKKAELEEINKQIKEIDDRLQKWGNENGNNQQPKNETDPNAKTVDNYTFKRHDENVFLSLVEGKNTITNENVFVAKINKQLDYKNEYSEIVKPLIEKYNGEWNTKIGGIVFKNSESAKEFKEEVENEFGEPHSDIQFMARGLNELDSAQKEYESAKKAFNSKRSELYRGIVNDQTDLFGTRKSAENSLFGNELEKANVEQIEKQLQPYKDRLSKAKIAVDQAFNNQNKQGTLFSSGIDNIGTITEQKQDKLFDRIQKAFGMEVTTNDDELISALVESGNNIDLDNNIIYGAKLPNGKVYINPKVLNAETPIHEASHLWEALYPKQWQEGISLFGNTEGFKQALKEIQEQPAYSSLSPEKMASEALNTLIGRKGEGYFKSGIVKSKFLAWLNKFIKTIGDKLGIRKLTPDDKLSFFVNQVISDTLSGKKLEGEQNDNLQFQVRQNQGPVTQDEIQDAKDKYYQALNDYITDNSKDIELIDAFDTVANISRNEAEKLIPETPVDIRDTFKEIVAETPLNDIEEKVSETPQPEQPKEDTPEQTTTEHENMLDEMLNPGRLFHEGTEILQDAKITSENRGFNAAGGTREEFAFIETSNRIHDIMKKYSSILMGDFYNSIEKILSDQLMPLWLKAAVLTRLQQAISEGEPILSKPLVENLTSKYSFGTEGVATEISSAMQLLAFTKQLTKEQKQQLLEIFGKTGSLIQLTRDQLSELVGSGVIDEITGTQLAEMSNQIEQSGKRFEELEADRKKLRDELDKEKMKKKAKKKNAAMRTASPNLLLNIQSQIQKINEIKC